MFSVTENWFSKPLRVTFSVIFWSRRTDESFLNRCRKDLRFFRQYATLFERKISFFSSYFLMFSVQKVRVSRVPLRVFWHYMILQKFQMLTLQFFEFFALF